MGYDMREYPDDIRNYSHRTAMLEAIFGCLRKRTRRKTLLSSHSQYYPELSVSWFQKRPPSQNDQFVAKHK